MGRPIVAGVSGEAARILEQSGAALVVPPCNAEALAEAICAMADTPAEQRNAMAANGVRFYSARLSFESAIARTLEVLNEADPVEARNALATAR
jgi:glycosyltransferase involved in cell wall biosynthesis